MSCFATSRAGCAGGLQGAGDGVLGADREPLWHLQSDLSGEVEEKRACHTRSLHMERMKEK